MWIARSACALTFWLAKWDNIALYTANGCVTQTRLRSVQGLYACVNVISIFHGKGQLHLHVVAHCYLFWCQCCRWCLCWMLDILFSIHFSLRPTLPACLSKFLSSSWPLRWSSLHRQISSAKSRSQRTSLGYLELLLLLSVKPRVALHLWLTSSLYSPVQ